MDRQFNHYMPTFRLNNDSKYWWYLSYILQILVSPLPFLKLSRVVDACARILPPIGFFGSTVNLNEEKIIHNKTQWKFNLQNRFYILKIGNSTVILTMISTEDIGKMFWHCKDRCFCSGSES
jgi:hypothetical protein